MAYFPSGIMSGYLHNQCGECIIPDDVACPILFAQITFNYEQFNEEGEETEMAELINFLVDKTGTCMMKPILDKSKNMKKNPKKWVSVKENLPEFDQKCIFLLRPVGAYREMIIGTYHYVFSEWYGDNRGFQRCEVTHWMELPSLPK